MSNDLTMIFPEISSTQGIWGGISGELQNQSDLMQLIDSKAAGNHNHSGVYSPVAHNHSGVYEPANSNIQAHIADVATDPHNVHAYIASRLGKKPCYSFVGSYLTGNVVPLNILPFTVHFKVNITAIATQQCFRDEYYDANNYFRIYLSTTHGIVCESKVGGTVHSIYKTSGISTITAGKHHIAVVSDRTTGAATEIYIDGVAISANVKTIDTTDNLTFTTNTVYIGKTGANANYFAGDISDIAVYNKTMTAAEVLEAYGQGLGSETDNKYQWGNSFGGIYTSDFSVGVNGWSNDNYGTGTGNQDGISDGTTSKDDCIKFHSSTRAGASLYDLKKTQSFTINKYYRIECWYYIPSANTVIDGFEIYADAGGISIYHKSTDGSSVKGTWTKVTDYFMNNSGNNDIRIFSMSGALDYFINSGANEDIYFKDIIITEIGCISLFNGDSAGSYTWKDKSVNGKHLTNSGCFLNVRNENVLAYLSGITGDSVLTNGLPYGYYVKKVLFNVTAGGASGKKINVGTSAGGNQVVAAYEVASNGLFDATIVLGSVLSLTTNGSIYVNDDSTSTAWSSGTQLTFDILVILGKAV